MYKPSLSKEEIEKIRKKHKIVLSKVSEHKKYYRVGRLKLKVYPKAFPPCPDSILFANFLSKLKNTGKVLDMGTGSGILALSIAKNASYVLAVDINKDALRSTKENALLNRINNIKFRYSNVFSNIKEKFDTIIFNPPFRFFKPKNLLDKSMTDHNYKTLSNFFKNVNKHLNKKGKIYIIFSNSGDIKYLEKMINKGGFSFKILKRVRSNLFGWDTKDFPNYYYIYKIQKKEK